MARVAFGGGRKVVSGQAVQGGQAPPGTIKLSNGLGAGGGRQVEIHCPCGDGTYVRTQQTLEIFQGFPRTMVAQYATGAVDENVPWVQFCQKHKNHLHQCGRCKRTGWDWQHGDWKPCCVNAKLLGEGTMFGVDDQGGMVLSLTESSLPPETPTEKEDAAQYMTEGHEFHVGLGRVTAIWFSGDVAALVGAYHLAKRPEVKAKYVQALETEARAGHIVPDQWNGIFNNPTQEVAWLAPRTRSR